MSIRSCINLGARLGAALALLALAACGTAPLQTTAGLPPAAVKPAPRPAVHAPATARQEPGVPVMPAAGSGRGAYYQDDGPGENPPPDLAKVPDADVRNDPLLPRSNRPYVVFGQTYTPIVGNQPFSQLGVGSWYGKKFHGQRTSSGELYDMYKMTAAHPTLPIPSYARLTNLITGVQVVVRINDRGPFHASRAIDVSYTAALKLGLLGKGSHELQIDRILPDEIDRILAARATAPVRTQLGPTPVKVAAALPPLVLAPRAVSGGAGGVAGIPTVTVTGSSGGASASATATAAAAPQNLGQGVSTARPVAPVVSPDIEALMLADRAPAAGGDDAGSTASTASPDSTASAAPGMVAGVGAVTAASMVTTATTAATSAAAVSVTDVAAPAASGGYYLQLGAYTRADNAETARARMATQAAGRLGALEVVQGGPVFRLFGGPFASRQDALVAMQAMPSSMGLKPIVIQR